MRHRPCDRCGQPGQPYLYGDRCQAHAKPVPIPDPALTLTGLRKAAGRADVASPLATSALIDERAIASTRRRSNATQYRLARAAEDERRAAR